MIFRIYSIGREKNKQLAAVRKIYLKRLSRYIRVEFHHIREARRGNKENTAVIRELEGEFLLKKCGPDSYVIALTEKGTRVTSRGLAKRAASLLRSGKKEVVFLVGGASGLGENVIDRADFTLSLSLLTFPHEIAQLVLCEQLYRSFTIIKGESYHK